MKYKNLLLLSIFLVQSSYAEMQEIIVENEKARIPVNIGVYGMACYPVLFDSEFFVPTFGVSIRSQKGVNGVEFDVGMPKVSVSYLYHKSGTRSGFYLGAGPGCVWLESPHPTITGFAGFQSASNGSDGKNLYGFIDAGIIAIFETFPEGLDILPVPAIRCGAGFSF